MFSKQEWQVMRFIPFGMIGLLAVLFTHDALGCRYSVRDAGFVDLGSSTYRLYLISDDQTRDRIPSPAKAYAILADSNVRVEAKDYTERGDEAFARFLEELHIDAPPAAVLVSPDGRSLVLSLPGPDSKGGDETWKLLDGLVSSPARNRILEDILDAFCVLLLIEGKEEAANQAARSEIGRAVERITGMLGRMPKPVKEPPRLITVPNDKIVDEKVLLFGLGIDESKTDLPHAVVLYGRGRRIGPVLEADSIQESFLFNIMMIVGADCECDLDRAWLQGKMIPLTWEETTQSKAADRLGFDPENPMVKMEVSRIVSFGPGGRAGMGTGAFPDLLEPDVLFGYREEAVLFDAAEAQETLPPEETAAALPSDVKSPQPADRSPEAEESAEAEYRSSLMLVIALLIVMLGGGLLVVMRSKTRR